MSKSNVSCLIKGDPRFRRLKKLAANYNSRTTEPLPKKYWKKLTNIKRALASKDDQSGAKAVWCLETIGKIQDHFVTAFNLFKKDEFYKGWCEIEKCQILTNFLDRHFQEEMDEFGIEYIRIHSKRFQDIFPYRFFMSPGIAVIEACCSICNQKITLRSDCGHEVGEIYNGELCCKINTKWALLETSIVTNPVQKYSVLFPEGAYYNYGAVKYVVDGLRSPWHGWNYEKTEIQKNEPLYKYSGPNAPCPCGSRRKLKRCCMGKKKTKTHYHIRFDISPPQKLPPYLSTAHHNVSTDPMVRREDTDYEDQGQTPPPAGKLDY